MRATLIQCEVGTVFETPLFTEALVSWNITLTGAGGFAVDIAVRFGDSGSWSPALEVGSWGERPEASPEGSKTHERCLVDVDHFKSAAACDALRLELRVWDGGSVCIERLSACVSDGVKSAAAPAIPSGDTIQIPVPFRSQMSESSEIARRICSPTSVAMLLDHNDIDVATTTVADLLHDPDENIYGNWCRAIQGAHVLGLAGHLERFTDLEGAEQTLLQGQPLIISIRAEPGDLLAAPYTKTTGHLLVLTGVTAKGDFRVNDPAAKTAEAGVATYPRAALHKTWIQNGGTAYVLYPKK